MRILVTDDEAKIVRLVGSYLEASGFTVDAACDGAEALARARQAKPDCAVLDINMPVMDGRALAVELRLLYPALPLIFLTARSAESDRVSGLESGADDYIVKPFSPRELVARVKALLRRSQQSAFSEGAAMPSPILKSGGVVLDPGRRVVSVNGEVKVLTAAQFSILELLLAHPGQVFSRSRLQDCLSPEGSDGFERTIDAHIKNIRKALGDSGNHPRLIGTVRGAGYKFTGGEK